MGLFSKTRRSGFPDDMFRWLETFGRFEFDPQHSGIDGGALGLRFGAFYQYANSDSEGFLAELRALVAGDRCGFASFGAARLVWEMYSEKALRIPAALILIDGGIEFKRARGLPPAVLTGYEKERLAQLGTQCRQPGNDPWK